MRARLFVFFVLVLALSVALFPGISPAPERASGAQFARAGPSPDLLSHVPCGPNVRVNDDLGTPSHQSSPSIAVDPSGNAYAVWMDRRSGYDDIYFAYRPAGGSWGTDGEVNDDPGAASQRWPSIAVDPSGNAYAVWTDTRNGSSDPDIYFSYRPAAGSWGTNVRLNDDAGTASQADPSIAVDPSGNAYAVWTDTRNGSSDPDIYFSYRPAAGSWGTNVRVNDDAGTASQANPSIAVDPSANAYAVWTDTRNGSSDLDIYFSYRPAAGSWSTNVRVDDDTGTAMAGVPSIAVDASANAYAVWVDLRNGSFNPDIYFSYRPAGGSWGTNVRVDDDPGAASQEWPSIAVDPSGNAYAVWEDERTAGDRNIHLSYRPAAGSWSSSVRVNDDVATPEEQGDPSIAVDASGNAYVVWYDARTVGDPDIYFSSISCTPMVYVPLVLRNHQ